MPVASELLVRVAADTKDLESGLSRADKQVSGFAKSASALGSVATAGFVALGAAAVGLGAGLASSISSASGFQAVISQVGAVSGASGQELQTLSDLALKMGADTAFSASEAAQAMAELAKGGVAVADMAAVLPGTLDLAAAGGLSLAEAATIATDAMAIFGAQGVTMDQVANAFAGAANISSISVSDMAEAMKYAGPVASSFGLSLEDVSAAIALLGANGLKGSQAGTGLRTVLTSLAAPTDKARGLMNDLGLQFFDSSGKMKDMAGISDELKTKLGGMSDAQRAATLQTLFGVEGMNAAIALMGTGENSIQSYTEKLRAAATAHATGAAMMDNFAGSMDQLKGSIETASITIGLMLLPYLRELVDWATRAVNAAVPFIKAWGPDLIEGIKSGVGQAIAVVRDFGGAVAATFRAFATGDFNQAFGPILKAIETTFGPDAVAPVALFVSNLLRWLQLARDAVITAKQAFSGDWVSADSIATPVRLIGEAFTFFGNAVRAIQGVIAQIPAPILAAAGAFIALGPAIRVAALVLPTLIGALTGLGPIISVLTSTLPLLGTVIAAIGLPITLVIAAVAALALAWTTNFMGIRDVTMPILQAIGAFITGTFLPALVAIGTTLMTAVMPLVQQFVGFLTGSLLPGIQGIIAVAVPAFQQMGAAVIGAFQAALPGIQAFIAGVQALGVAVLPIIQAIATTIMNSLGPAVMAIVDWAQTVIPQFAAAWVTVWGIIGPVIGAIASFIGATLSTIAGFISAHSSEIIGILQSAWGVISGVIGIAFALITGIISTGLQLISGDWTGAWNTIKETAATVWAGIQQVISSAISLVQGVITVALAAIEGIASAAWSAIQSAASAAWAAIVGAVQQAMSNLASAVQSGVAALPGIVLGIGGALFSAGAAIIGQMIAGIQSKIGEAIQIVKDGIQKIADLLPGSEPKDATSPLRGLGERGAAIFGNLAEGIAQGTPEAVTAAANAASAVAKAITDTLGAMAAVATFDFASNSPSGETLGWLRHMAESLVATLQGVAETIGTEGLTAAKAAADAMGGIGNAVKSSLEGLQALAQYDFTKGSPTGEAMGWFRHLMESIVLNFSQAAALVGTEAMDQAKAFASAVSEVVGAAKAGLELFKQLIEVKDLPAQILTELWKALEGALSAMGDLVSRSDALKNSALDYLANMEATALAVLKAQSLGNGLGGSVPALPGGWTPGNFPALAAGGVVTQPTLALIGERGPEAVIPLSRYDRAGGGGGLTVNVYMQAPSYGQRDTENMVVAAVRSAYQRGRPLVVGV